MDCVEMSLLPKPRNYHGFITRQYLVKVHLCAVPRAKITSINKLVCVMYLLCTYKSSCSKHMVDFGKEKACLD